MLRSVVENIPSICQLKPEQEECLVHILNGGDVVALLPTGFGKSLIYQLLPIVSEKLGRPKSGKVIIVIVLHSLACTMIEGNFSLIFSSPESWILNPKWQAVLASTLYQDNLVFIVIDEAHVTYKWWVCIQGFGY